MTSLLPLMVRFQRRGPSLEFAWVASEPARTTATRRATPASHLYIHTPLFRVEARSMILRATGRDGREAERLGLLGLEGFTLRESFLDGVHDRAGRLLEFHRIQGRHRGDVGPRRWAIAFDEVGAGVGEQDAQLGFVQAHGLEQVVAVEPAAREGQE